MRAKIFVMAISAAVAFAGIRMVRAGSGPENCIVVVNTESWASLTVANHFVRDRGIPIGNVVFESFKLARLDDRTDVETFREKLLKPVLAAIKDRGLEKQIDCIAWSSDFPTSIDYSADLAKGAPHDYPNASINGLTFLYEQVLAKNSAAYLALNANHYYRLEKATGKDAAGKPAYDVETSVAFSAQTGWAADGRPAPDGQHYMLSVVLGVTSGRGNTVHEVVDALARSAAADGTSPKGTFYYTVNWNIRSTTRQWGFASAIAKLKELGVAGELDKDTFPQHKQDVMGAMLGLIYPKEEEAGSKTLPGAIVENLTSEGGTMNWGGGQTPISDFIRQGAAGTSGTVVEPNAIQAKFPSPFIFYDYASGNTLAEAFYAAVHGPYQLLIVGDPLCQPYAKSPKIADVAAGPPGSGVIYVTELAKGSPPAAEYQLFVDGKLNQTTKDGRFTQGGKPGAGYHEMSVEAVGASAVAARGRKVWPLILSTAAVLKIALAPSAKPVVFGKEISLTVASEGASKIELRHMGRVVATVAGATGKVEIDLRAVGMGPVQLQAVAEVGGKQVASEPLEVDVVPEAPLAAVAVKVPEGEALVDGPILTSEKIAGEHVVLDMRRRAALQEGKVPAGAEYKIEAYFDAGADDLYQFQVWTDGKAEVKVDDVAIGAAGASEWAFLPVALLRGKHRMTVTGTAGAGRELTIRFGGPGSRDIGARAHVFDAENVALHFAHIGAKPPATTQAGAGAK